MKLEDCGIPLSERFAFYDQVPRLTSLIQQKAIQQEPAYRTEWQIHAELEAMS